MSAQMITIRKNYTLPSSREGRGRNEVERERYDTDDWRSPVEWAVETLRDAGCTRHNWGPRWITEEPKVTDYSRGEEMTKTAELEGFSVEELQEIHAGMGDA